jgi:hypothetical protein
MFSNPGFNKLQLIEKFIENNPKHKDEILSFVGKTVDEQFQI